MPTVSQLLNLAIKHHNNGQLAQAESLYRQILAHDRHHAEALHLLGVVLSQTGQYQEGVQFIKKAIKRNKKSATCYSNLGAALKELGKYKEAAVACRQALALNPHPAAETYNNLGVALQKQGQLKEAMENFRRALVIKPNFAEVYSNIGEVLRAQGQLEEAIASYQQALVINPQLASAHQNLGIAFMEQGQLEKALESYQRALAINPKYAKAYYNLGSLFFRQGKLDQAIACLSQTLALQPTDVKANTLLSRVLLEQGKLHEAIAISQQALKINQNSAEAHLNLAGALFRLGKIEEVIQHYKKAIAVNPDNVIAHSGLVIAMNYSSQYEVKTLFAEHLRFAKRHAEPLQALIKPHLNNPSPQRRLKIGYVSPDLRNHPTAYFMEPVLAAHDHQPFEIFAYADVRVPDETTTRLQGYVDQWQNIMGLSDEKVAEQIRQDEIDILVDLAGHTDGNRMLLFARKPAPVQVTYLGYPNTTGLTTMDYKITDSVIDPPGQTEAYHTEKLVRLPIYRIVNFKIEDSPEVNSLPALTSKQIMFASLNNFSKVSPYILSVWAKILVAIPHAKLKIVHPDADNSETQQSIKKFFTQDEKVHERVEIIGNQPFQEFLKLHNHIDVSLDPFPHMGGTTTFISLWMGVPVITLAGKTPLSRGGAPLMTLGLDNLIAKTPEEYVEIAVGLANRLEELNELRMNLREKMRHSPLMDAESFTRSLEAAYRQMWYDWCKER